MKHKTRLLFALLPALTMLVACGGGESTSTSDGDTTSQSSEEHPYNQKVVDDKYLASEATCTEPATYYYSNDLGEAGTETFTYGDPLGHDLTHHEEVASTCSVAGTAEYWECSRCGKLFSDEAATTEISEPEALPLAEHTYGEWEISSESAYPNMVWTRTCSVCGETETKNVTGYDLQTFDCGMTVTLLDDTGAKTDTLVTLQNDEVEPGLVALIGDNEEWRDHQIFEVDLPKVDYTQFSQVEWDFIPYNIMNREGGTAGSTCFTILPDHLDWMITTGNLVYPTIKLKISWDGTNISGVLSGAADGNTQVIGSERITDDIKTGKDPMRVFFIINDGYRNLIIKNPIFRTSYEYSADELHGCNVTIDGTVINPTYDTDTYYVTGEDKLYFDLTDKGAESATTATFTLPAIDLTTYDNVAFPLYMATGDQGAGHLQFSFDGTTYFAADLLSESSTSYVQFIKNDTGYEVQYIADGQVQGTMQLTDTGIINGNSGLTLSLKADVNWRKFAVGLPIETRVALTYNYSYSTYGSIVYWGDTTVTTVEPQDVTTTLDGQAPTGVRKLRFDLGGTGANSVDYFRIRLPQIRYLDYEDFYLPFYIETGCASTESADLQFSFDGENYFHASTEDGQTNYIHFVKNGSSYNVTYRVAGEEDTTITYTLSNTDILDGDAPFDIYGAAAVDYRKFSILEPTKNLPAEDEIVPSGDTDSNLLGSGYAPFNLSSTSTLPTGYWNATATGAIQVVQNGVTINASTSIGRDPLSHNSGTQWFFEVATNTWHFPTEDGTALAAWSDGDQIIVNGTFTSNEDSTYSIDLNFTLTWYSTGTVVTTA